MGTSGTEEPRFTFWVAVCFTVNFMMGTGFLTLPWAFSKAGVLLSILLMALVGGMALVANNFILDSMSRYLVLNGGYEQFFGERMVGFKHDAEYGDESDVHDEERRILTFCASDKDKRQVNRSSSSSSGSNSNKNKTVDGKTVDNKNVGDEKLVDITDMCELFLGEWGRDVYLLVVVVNIYSTLTCYCSVFATSFAYQMPLYHRHDHNYNLWLAVFFVVAVPASCIELNEQIEWQVFLSYCRALLAIIMLGSLCLAMYVHRSIEAPTEQDAYEGFTFTSFSEAPYGAPIWNMGGALVLLPLGAAANVFQYSIPSLSQPVEDKRSLAYIFGTAVIACFIVYSTLGASLAMFFGAGMPPSANTAWSSFHGSARGHYAWIASSLASYVVLFPALDVSSAFPLNAISLGNSMYTTMQEYTFIKQLFKGGNDSQYKVGPQKDENMDINSCSTSSGNIISNYVVNGVFGKNLCWGYKFSQLEIKIIFRLLAACPPFLFAIIIQDLEKITTYAGLNAFLIAMVFPPLLAYTSKQMMQAKGLSPKTPFSNEYLSNDILMMIMLVIGMSFFVFVLFEVVKHDHSEGNKGVKIAHLHQEHDKYHTIGSAVLQNVTQAARKVINSHSHHGK